MKRFYCTVCKHVVRPLRGHLPEGTRLEPGPKGPIYVYRAKDGVCHHREPGKPYAQAQVSR